MLSSVDLPASVPPVSSLSMLSALTEMLFLGRTSVRLTGFLEKSEAFPWELNKKNNVGILLPTLCCWGSTTATPGQSSKGTQRHRSSFSRKRQEIPSTRETCRTLPSQGRYASLLHLMTHRESENVLRRCSAAKQSIGTEQGFRKCSFLIKSSSCCWSCQVAPQGQRQLWSCSARSSHCCPSPAWAQGPPRPSPPLLPTARCHLLSCSLWMRSQECRDGTFCYSERPAKPGSSNSRLQCIVCWALVMLLDMHIKKLEFLHGYFLELTGV